MLGAMVGDIAGSAYDFVPGRSEFPLLPEGASFTDDTVLAIATADALLRGRAYGEAYRAWGRRYPERSYGSRFRAWLRARDPKPYGSWGNGAAVRASPIGWAFGSLPRVLAEAGRSAAVTHDHPEGTRGALAVAGCVFLARSGASRAELRAFLRGMIGYRLDRIPTELGPSCGGDTSCQGSVPQALTAFLESGSFEEAVRKAVRSGGDPHAQAAIAGSVAEAFYGGVPERFCGDALARLTPPMAVVLRRFESLHGRQERGDGAGPVPVRGREECAEPPGPETGHARRPLPPFPTFWHTGPPAVDAFSHGGHGRLPRQAVLAGGAGGGPAAGALGLGELGVVKKCAPVTLAMSGLQGHVPCRQDRVSPSSARSSPGSSSRPRL